MRCVGLGLAVFKEVKLGSSGATRSVAVVCCFGWIAGKVAPCFLGVGVRPEGFDCRARC